MFWPDPATSHSWGCNLCTLLLWLIGRVVIVTFCPDYFAALFAWWYSGVKEPVVVGVGSLVDDTGGRHLALSFAVGCTNEEY